MEAVANFAGDLARRSASSSSSSSGSSSTETWTNGYYTNLGQPYFVEVAVFLCITTVAVVFELSHHQLHHYLVHTVKFDVLAAYGQRRKTEAERPKHHLIGGNQHVVALYNRVSGELMVLGFVAFVVWICYKSELYHNVADDLAEKYNSAPDYYFLYNECHDVHVWLFLSMVAHFGISYLCIFKVSAKQKRLAMYQRGEDGGDPDKFKQFQDLKKMFIDHYKERELSGMTDNFDFALYVSLNFDRILADFYNFHVSAWLCVLFIKAVECVALGILADMPHWEWHDKLILCLTVGGIAPIVLTFSYCRRHSQINTDIAAGHFPEANGGCGESYDIELWMSRLYQALAFTVSYEFMRQLGNKELWHANDVDDWPEGGQGNHAWAVFLSVGSVAVLWIITVVLLPKALTGMSFVFMLPPFVDEENMALLRTVIDNQDNKPNGEEEPEQKAPLGMGVQAYDDEQL